MAFTILFFIFLVVHIESEQTNLTNSMKQSSWREISVLSFFFNILLFYGGELLAPCCLPSCRTTPFPLSTTAYSVYLQLPSTSGGFYLHVKQKDVPYCSDKKLELIQTL
jgi:hypothetical protein